MENPRFIAFDTKEMNDTDKLIGKLLKKSVEHMNNKAGLNPIDYRKYNSSKVEEFSVSSMKEVADSVGFDKNRIELRSGLLFPDIILKTTNYGVEVKSTQKDEWKSTGSSIMENTRIDGIDRIYMLFGKLGGTPEFRCKPYQSCLSNIAVTHSPRYLIDMELEADESIFAMMGKKYDDFRLLDDKDKASEYRRYFIEKARREGKQEMPWWVWGTTSATVSMLNDQGKTSQNNYIDRACILFDSIYKSDAYNRYKPVALWLCARYSLLSHNLRDYFSAGGKCKNMPGHYPHIVGKLMGRSKYIKFLLDNPDEDLLSDIKDYWNFKYNPGNLYEEWISNVLEKTFAQNPELRNVPIRALLEKSI